MSQKIDVSKPLTDQERDYLHSRGEHARVEFIDEQHGKADGAASGDDLFDVDDDRPYDEWTKAELDAEIQLRNAATGRPADKQLAKGGTIADKAERLRADDEYLDSVQ